MIITVDQIKKLRDETQAGVIRCQKALHEAGGDLEKAKEILRQEGAISAQKKLNREVSEGVVETYVHNDKRLGAILELGCETDFVARTEDFKKLAHDLCLQVVAARPESVDQLLDQEFIKDTSKTVKDVITEAIAKLGENIVVRRFERYEIGDTRM